MGQTSNCRVQCQDVVYKDGVQQRSGQPQSKSCPLLARGGGQLCRVVPRDALQQRCLAAAAWPLIAVRGDSCQAAIGPSPPKKEENKINKWRGHLAEWFIAVPWCHGVDVQSAVHS